MNRRAPALALVVGISAVATLTAAVGAFARRAWPSGLALVVLATALLATAVELVRYRLAGER